MAQIGRQKNATPANWGVAFSFVSIKLVFEITFYLCGFTFKQKSQKEFWIKVNPIKISCHEPDEINFGCIFRVHYEQTFLRVGHFCYKKSSFKFNTSRLHGLMQIYSLSLSTNNIPRFLARIIHFKMEDWKLSNIACGKACTVCEEKIQKLEAWVNFSSAPIWAIKIRLTP